jgi:hypothetical protein
MTPAAASAETIDAAERRPISRYSFAYGVSWMFARSARGGIEIGRAVQQEC